MDEEEARLILRAYRPRGEEKSDPQFAEALRATRTNPALARWFEEEQAFDRAVAAHLEAIPAPFALKTRILAEAPQARRAPLMRWVFGVGVAAAVLLLLAQFFGPWNRPKSNLPADYAQEMVSFIQLPPPLQLEENNLIAIKDWLQKKNVRPVEVPARLAALEPVGCRILSFRSHEVTLICFHREGNRVAHLFVVDRAAMPKLQPGDKPIFANEHGWMTATWAEGDHIYMVAMQGARSEVEQYLPRA